MGTTKITLSEKHKKWLFLHYKHTKNAEIAQKLGISESSLHRIAREMGLQKSKQFMVKCQAEAAEAADRSNRENSTYPPKGYLIPGWEKGAFKPGVTPAQRLGKKKNAERIRKSAESRARTYKNEKARAVWGFEQRTKLRVIKKPREKILLRYYLKKRGYILDDQERIAYYNDATKRGKRIENKQQPWYIFKPENVNAAE